MRTGAVSGHEDPFEDIFDDEEHPLAFCGMIDYTVKGSNPTRAPVSFAPGTEARNKLIAQQEKYGDLFGGEYVWDS